MDLRELPTISKLGIRLTVRSLYIIYGSTVCLSASYRFLNRLFILVNYMHDNTIFFPLSFQITLFNQTCKLIIAYDDMVKKFDA